MINSSRLCLRTCRSGLKRSHVWISLPGAKEERSDAAEPAHFWIYSAALIPEMVTPVTLLLCRRGLCTHDRSLFISGLNHIYMLRLTMTRISHLLMYTCQLGPPPFSLSISLSLRHWLRVALIKALRQTQISIVIFLCEDPEELAWQQHIVLLNNAVLFPYAQYGQNNEC